MYTIVCALLLVIFGVQSKPLELDRTGIEPTLELVPEHHLTKRFINPSMTSGGFTSNGISKIRAKRESEDECEKLRLCQLHAESNRNFIAAFELYFVNKENARLWDHRAHSFSDCQQRYSCYR